MKNIRFSFVIIIVSLCLFWGCAKRGYITGGPIDSLPPVVLKSSPENHSVQFSESEIEIFFDEYVKIQNANQNLIVSPPLNQSPEIIPMGYAAKKITIKIHDTLKPNTTYNFNFGQSIVDNNEGNALGNFSYVFSTGDYIDSLKISGSIQDALSKKTAENVKIMLYPAAQFNDSTVYKEKPLYVSNSLADNSFEIKNLKEGEYQIVALHDKNNNYLFNPKSEKIGFVDQLVHLPQDEELLYQLSLFKEKSTAKASRPSMASQNKWLLPFEGNAKKLSVQVLADNKPIETYVQKVKKADSLHVFTPLITYDSLQFNLSSDDGYQETYTVKPRKLKTLDSLMVNISKSGTIGFRDSVQLSVSTPITKIDSSLFSLTKTDSTAVPFSLHYDALNSNIHIDFDREEKQNYQLDILPNALQDFYGKTNDTLAYKLKTNAFTDYGNLSINLINPTEKFPLIVELLDDKENILYTEYVTDNNLVNFPLLPPKMYYIRVIVDENANRKWDSGNYLNKTQPEAVFYETQPIDVRANWEITEDFTLE